MFLSTLNAFFLWACEIGRYILFDRGSFVFEVMPRYVFSRNSLKTFLSFSPLSSSWLSSELLHAHRGEGLELANSSGGQKNGGEGQAIRGDSLD